MAWENTISYASSSERCSPGDLLFRIGHSHMGWHDKDCRISNRFVLLSEHLVKVPLALKAPLFFTSCFFAIVIWSGTTILVVWKGYVPKTARRQFQGSEQCREAQWTLSDRCSQLWPVPHRLLARKQFLSLTFTYPCRQLFPFLETCRARYATIGVRTLDWIYELWHNRLIRQRIRPLKIERFRDIANRIQTLAIIF